MDSQIRSLLDELYQAEPALREHETELIGIIAALMRAQPHLTINQAFIDTLRGRVLARARSQHQSMEPEEQKNLLRRFSPFSLLFGGAALALLVAVPLLKQNQTPPLVPALLLPSSLSITDLGSSAYGSLASLVAETPAAMGVGAGSATRFQSGGGGEKLGMMPAFEGKRIVFSFEGELPELEAVGEVYRRDKGVSLHSAGSGEDAVKNFDLGLANISSFSGMRLQNFSLIQDAPNGYVITVDAQEGFLNINQNWAMWNNPSADCRDDECWRRNRVRLEQLPPDAETLAIAAAFVKQAGVPTDGYGEPFVDHAWRIFYEQSLDKDEAFVPEQLSVKYPLMLEGKPVFEAYGEQAGMVVMVDVRTKKPAGLVAMTRKFSRSSYQLVNDEKRILALAARGGSMPYYQMTGETVESMVMLGNPVFSYVRTWSAGQDIPHELYVPALVFPVETPQGYTGPARIIVPLAVEIFESLEQQDTNGPIPFMKTEPLPAAASL